MYVLITIKNEVSDLSTVATKAHLVSSNSPKNNSNDIEMKNNFFTNGEVGYVTEINKSASLKPKIFERNARE